MSRSDHVRPIKHNKSELRTKERRPRLPESRSKRALAIASEVADMVAEYEVSEKYR